MKKDKSDVIQNGLHSMQPVRLVRTKTSYDGKWSLGSEEYIRMPITSKIAKWYRYINHHFETSNDLESMALELIYEEINDIT